MSGRPFAPLDDTPQRDYSGKLRSFEAFVAPELAQIIDDVMIDRHAAVLDLCCGAGLVTDQLTVRGALVVGLDLAAAHARAAADRAGSAAILVADGTELPFKDEAFDVVWSCNTVNHFADPITTLHDVGRTLRPNGRLVVAQSSLLPEMMFAWDYHFDARIRAACHAYYRQKHGLTETDTAGSMRLLGLVRDAGFATTRARTYVIERFAPLSPNDRTYFLWFFRNYWGPKLRPHLTETDWQQLGMACDPESPFFCLDRPDFHHIQTLTVVEGRRVSRSQPQAHAAAIPFARSSAT